MSRWGIRFADSAIELRYLRWLEVEAIALTRIAMLVILLVWGTLVVWCAVLKPGQTLWLAAYSMIGVFPVTICLMSITRRSWRSWLSVLATLTNALSGASAVGLAWLLESPLIATHLTVWFTYIGLVVLRLNVLRAITMTIPIILIHQALLIRGFVRADFNALLLLSETVVPWMHFAGALLAGVVVARVSREAYYRKQVLEEQRRETHRKREELDRLAHEAVQRELLVLGSELRRQVAARSRNLLEEIAQHSNSSSSILIPEMVIDDRYRVCRLLGEGGMGRVYEVERLADRRHMALKLLKATMHTSALMRFAREAEIAAELEHANVVPVLDIGTTSDGVLFLVMELVEGPSLAAMQSKYGDVGWALPIVAQVAEALVVMHSAGIVHRDLKPENILLDGDRVKVTDFGVAGFVSVQDVVHTHTKKPLGTLAYIAPELAESNAPVRPSCDVFSLGVLAFRLLTGGMPHVAPPVLVRSDCQEAKCAKFAEACRSVPAEACSILDDCLSREPQARPSAATVVAVLRRCAAAVVSRV